MAGVSIPLQSYDLSKCDLEYLDSMSSWHDLHFSVWAQEMRITSFSLEVSFSEHITGVDDPVNSRPVEITFLPVTSEMCSTVTNTSTLVRKRGVAYPILVDQQLQTAATVAGLREDI